MIVIENKYIFKFFITFFFLRTWYSSFPVQCGTYCEETIHFFFFFFSEADYIFLSLPFMSALPQVPIPWLLCRNFNSRQSLLPFVFKLKKKK